MGKLSDKQNTGRVMSKLAGPVQSLRWNVRDGTFTLQYATDAVIFDDNGQYKRMEIVWVDVPIVYDAQTVEQSEQSHIKDLISRPN